MSAAGPARQTSSSQMKWKPKASKEAAPAVEVEWFAAETGSTESRRRPSMKGSAKDGGRQEGGTGGTSGYEAHEKCSKTLQVQSGTFGAAISKLHKASPRDDEHLYSLFGNAVTLPTQGASKLLHLRFSGQRIGDQGLVDLAKYVDSALDSSGDEGMWANLELDNNNFGDNGLTALIDVLQKHSVSIRRARLYNNSITDRGGVRLATAVRQQDHAFEELHLSHNRLTARTLVGLCLAAASKRQMRRVPCWVRLEMNRIAEPLKVVELLHNDAWISTCMAKSRNHCAPDRCALCSGHRQIIPRVHLFLVNSQRNDALYVDPAELSAEMFNWWEAVGSKPLKKPAAYEEVQTLGDNVPETEDMEDRELGDSFEKKADACIESRNKMPVLLGRAGMSEQTNVSLADAKDLALNYLPVPPPPPPPGLGPLDHDSDSRHEEACSSAGTDDMIEQRQREKRGKNKILVEVSSSESSTSVDGEGSEHSESDAPSDGKAAGQMLLSMLKADECTDAPARPDPQPLSTDEYQLWTMQAREDREMGADEFNVETFGVDHGCGWSFEENLAANAHLTAYTPAAECGQWSYRQVAESYGYQQIARDATSLRKTLQEMAEFMQMQPWCLKEAVRYVMKEGWHSITWRNKYTGLHLAAELGQADVMPLLVWLGADPASEDYKGRTAMDVAEKHHHRQCVTMLDELQNSASCRFLTVSEDGSPPARFLFNAVREATKFMDLEPLRFREAIWHLIVTGSSTIPWYETTVLNMAVECGRSDLIPLLYSLNADPYQVDGCGQSAFDLAYSTGSWGCIHGLKQGIKPSSTDETEPSDREEPPKDKLLRLRSVPPPR